MTIEGRIVDAVTGEGLPGAHVYYEDDLSATGFLGTTTDVDGYFSGEFPEGAAVSVSMVGYAPESFRAVGSPVDILMSPGVELVELEVTPTPSTNAWAPLVLLLIGGLVLFKR